MPSGGRVREQDQRQVFRLMAQEEAHGFVDGVVGDQVVVVDHQVQRLVPVGQLDKQLGEQRRQAGVLVFLAQHLALDAAAAAGLLQRGDQVAGEALRLVVAHPANTSPDRPCRPPIGRSAWFSRIPPGN